MLPTALVEIKSTTQVSEDDTSVLRCFEKPHHGAFFTLIVLEK